MATLAAITSLAISCDDEDSLIVGSENGNLVCVSIQTIVEKARAQRDEIMLRPREGLLVCWSVHDSSSLA